MAPAPFVMLGIPVDAVDAVDAELDRMDAVTSDLRRYLKTGGPTPAELETAPTVDDWDLVVTSGAAIVAGIVHGHPHIGSGRLGRTSQIVAIARDRTWVRSLNRLWRLGTPAGRHPPGHA